MTIKNLDGISYAEKRYLVSEACAMYRRIKMLINKTENDTSLKVSDIAKLNITSTLKTVSTFEIVLGLLSRSHLEIINNEFIEPEINHREWYTKKYSRSGFYRIKHEAVDSFLKLLYF